MKALRYVGASCDTFYVENYIILFDSVDLEGETFRRFTDVESAYTKAGILPVSWEHGMATLKGKDILGYVLWNTARKDQRGWKVVRALDRTNRFVRALEPYIKEGKIGSSSEALSANVKKGVILKWELRGDALTVIPAEPKMLTENTITHLPDYK